MAYSDYVQIYNVAQEAGTSASDDRLTQVTKIAAWLNSKFSDYITASVTEDVYLDFVVKGTTAGVRWGVSSSVPNTRKCLLNGVSYGTNNDYGSITITEMQLFVCITKNVFVIDIIRPVEDKNSYGTNEPRLIAMTDKDGNKCVLSGYNYGNSQSQWIVYTPSQQYVGILSNEMFGAMNQNLTTTLLTRFVPYILNFIPEDVYLLRSKTPSGKTIFEIDGVKYLALGYCWPSGSYAYSDYSTRTNGLAIKLG